MTTFDHPLASIPAADIGRLVVAPVAAGLLLGIGDLVVMTHVAYPWANLANSSAFWAIGAFLLGAALRTDPARAAVAGVVMMLVAVEAYYGYAAMLDLGGMATMWSPHAQMWMVFGVFAGVVFGVAGAWTSGTVWWQRVLGAAIGAGVLLGEALHTLRHLDAAHLYFHSELARTAVLMAVLGVVILLVSTRRTSVLVVAAVASVPAAFFSAAAFSAVGIAY